MVAAFPPPVPSENIERQNASHALWELRHMQYQRLFTFVLLC